MKYVCIGSSLILESSFHLAKTVFVAWICRVNSQIILVHPGVHMDSSMEWRRVYELLSFSVIVLQSDTCLQLRQPITDERKRTDSLIQPFLV